jgi:hypothetical protein
MIKPRRTSGLIFWVLLIMATPFQEPAITAQLCTRDDHVAWVSDVLKRMKTIKPGMTRKALLDVFYLDGGLHPLPKLGTRIQTGRFVSRDCSYFKVDVELQIAPPEYSEGRLKFQEDPQDIILTISKPYLEHPIWD